MSATYFLEDPPRGDRERERAETRQNKREGVAGAAVTALGLPSGRFLSSIGCLVQQPDREGEKSVAHPRSL